MRKKFWLKSFSLALVLLFILTQVVAASSTTYVFLGTRTRGASAINAYYYGSTVGSVSGYNYKSDMDASIPSWNGITSKVNITLTTSGPDYDYYMVTTSQVYDNYATTFPYNELHILTGVGNDWYFCSVSLYDNVMKSLTSSEKQSVITHETGHTLKLRHPTASETTNSVMTAAGLSITRPTSDDKATLIFEWGN